MDIETLQRAVARFVAEERLLSAGARVVVAVSGGADSVTLLDVLRALPPRLMLHVATLDHGIRGTAGAEDAAFVRHLAREWGLAVTVGRADVPALAERLGLGLEATARGVRYAFLARVAHAWGAEVVAVGHTRDDQAETVLLHVLRGSGLAGLRAMLPAAPLHVPSAFVDVPVMCDPPLPSSEAGQGALRVVRPLLRVSRAQVERYVAARGLQPRSDATNRDPTYRRNWVRHEVLPLLERGNPRVREALARLAELARDEYALVAQASEAALARVVRAARAGAAELSRAEWGKLSRAEKRYVLRALCARLCPSAELGFVHIEAARRVADGGRVGAVAVLPAGWRLRVGYDVLILATESALAERVTATEAPALPRAGEALSFRPDETVRRRFGCWEFVARPLRSDEDARAWLGDPLAALLSVPRGARLTLRTRRAGERFRPRGMGGHSRKLADMLSDARVPAAWRDRVPLLTVNGEPAWFVVPTAAGLRGRVAEPFALEVGGETRAQARVLVRWWYVYR